GRSRAGCAIPRWGGGAAGRGVDFPWSATGPAWRRRRWSASSRRSRARRPSPGDERLHDPPVGAEERIEEESDRRGRQRAEAEPRREIRHEVTITPAPQRLHGAALGGDVAPRRGPREERVDREALGNPAAPGRVENADRLEDEQGRREDGQRGRVVVREQ